MEDFDDYEDPYLARRDTVSLGIVRPPRDEDEVRRDTNGRPFIREVNILGKVTGKSSAYTRVTKYIDCVDDKTALGRWSERQVVIGLVGQRGVRFRAEAAPLITEDNPRKLNALVKKIKEAAGAEDKAAIGTAVHALTERYDLGLEIGELEDMFTNDLNAYIEATKYLRHHEVERLMVNDQLRTAGTPDRITEYEPCSLCGCKFYIFDLKTGRVDGYTQNSQAMQLSVYAHSLFYDPKTGERSMPYDICQHRGIICGLPAGSGKADLTWIDIEAGWGLVRIATAVRKARSIKARRMEFKAAPNLTMMIGQIDGPGAREELNALYTKYREFWTPEHTKAGEARLDVIQHVRSDQGPERERHGEYSDE